MGGGAAAAARAHSPSYLLHFLVALLVISATLAMRSGPDSTLPVASHRPPDLEVGFCNSDGSGFYSEQPVDQLERWNLPFDNGTHLVINWKSSKLVSGRNVSSYLVDVKTSLPVLNMFVGPFGGFPQDVCAPGGSKARNAVNVEDTATKGTCVPYALDAHLRERRTAFEVPGALRTLAKLDVTVTVRGYGSHAPLGRPQESVPAVWWCKKYRKPDSTPRDHGAAQAEDRSAGRKTSRSNANANANGSTSGSSSPWWRKLIPKKTRS